jgi:hypothetical protein
MAADKLEAMTFKLRGAQAELHLFIIEEEEISEVASDLRGVIEKIEQIILKLHSPHRY